MLIDRVRSDAGRRGGHCADAGTPGADGGVASFGRDATIANGYAGE